MTVQGTLVLNWTHLWFAAIWLTFGALCTIYVGRRGIAVGAIVATLSGLFVHGALLKYSPGAGGGFTGPGTDLNVWVPDLLIPFFAVIIGSLIGELIKPSVED